MMNKRNIYILGGLMLAACTPFEGVNPDGTDGDGNLPPVALEIREVQTPGVFHNNGINAGTGAGTRTAEAGSTATTRAATYVPYNSTGSIGFFRMVKPQYGYTAVNNRKGQLVTRTINGTGDTYQAWVPTDSIWLNFYSSIMAVYAPYDEAQTDENHPGTIKLNSCLLTGSEDEKAKKFIYAKWWRCSRAEAHQRAPLKLEHVYSRLTFVVKRQSYYLDAVTLGELKLKTSPVYAFVPTDVDCRYIFFPNIQYDIPRYNSHFTIPDVGTGIPVATNAAANAAASTTIDLLMIPNKTSTGMDVDYILLSLKVNGQLMQAPIDKSLFAYDGGISLQAGKHYTVNLILTPKQLEVAEVTVEDWIEEASTTHLKPKFDAEPGIQVARDEIFSYSGDCGDAEKDVLAGLTWAEGNLASVDRLVGPDLKQYEWTVYPEEYGIYYTGRISHTSPDLCKLLMPEKYGTGWRIPYQWEFDALIKCSQFPDTQTYTNGTKESRYIQCLNDYYGVKLPCAGFSSAYRQQQEQSEASAYPTDEEGNGYYWLEMDEDMLKNKKGFPYIQLDTYNGYYTYGYIPMSDPGGRYTAYSIRCVKGTSVPPPGWTTK